MPHNLRFSGFDEREIIKLHGRGISPEMRDRSFAPSVTTKDRAMGTGLGLSGSHGIVKDHDGRLTVETKPNHFTRFHLDLPAEDGWELKE